MIDSTTEKSHRHDTYQAILRTWAETLKIPESSIGEHDNFFALGGSSMLAFLVNAGLEEIFSARLPADGIPISAIATEPDLASFASHIERVMSPTEKSVDHQLEIYDEGSI